MSRMPSIERRYRYYLLNVIFLVALSIKPRKMHDVDVHVIVQPLLKEGCCWALKEIRYELTPRSRGSAYCLARRTRLVMTGSVHRG